MLSSPSQGQTHPPSSLLSQFRVTPHSRTPVEATPSPTPVALDFIDPTSPYLWSEATQSVVKNFRMKFTTTDYINLSYVFVHSSYFTTETSSWMQSLSKSASKEWSFSFRTSQRYGSWNSLSSFIGTIINCRFPKNYMDWLNWKRCW